MLKLSEASSYFDRTEIKDPDTGSLLFLGQVDPFDDAKRDAGGAYRRILSVAPGTTLPAARAIRIFGQVWLAGSSEVDGLEEMHRDKYVLQQAHVKYSVSRLPAYLTATPTLSSWGSVEWVKDAKEIDSSSRAVPIFTVYFGSAADVREYDIIWWGVSAHLATAVHLQASGFLAATCVKLEYPAVDATLSTRTYDPAAGAYTSTTTSAVKALRVRWQSLFLYGSQADAHYKSGDCTIVLPSGTTVATKDTLTLAGKVWGVVSVEALAGAVLVHGRPV